MNSGVPYPALRTGSGSTQACGHAGSRADRHCLCPPTQLLTVGDLRIFWFSVNCAFDPTQALARTGVSPFLSVRSLSAVWRLSIAPPRANLCRVLADPVGIATDSGVTHLLGRAGAADAGTAISRLRCPLCRTQRLRRPSLEAGNSAEGHEHQLLLRSGR